MNVKHALGAAALVVALAGCGGASNSSGAASGQATAAPAATTAPAAATAAKPAAATTPGAATTPAAGAQAAGGKVNANTATIDQLTAAFTAAGISNASRWAREVDEYRPYPANDPNLAKLRQNLAKYNPGQETVDKIVATLSVS